MMEERERGTGGKKFWSERDQINHSRRRERGKGEPIYCDLERSDQKKGQRVVIGRKKKRINEDNVEGVEKAKEVQDHQKEERNDGVEGKNKRHWQRRGSQGKRVVKEKGQRVEGNENKGQGVQGRGN